MGRLAVPLMLLYLMLNPTLVGGQDAICVPPIANEVSSKRVGFVR